MLYGKTDGKTEYFGGGFMAKIKLLTQDRLTRFLLDFTDGGNLYLRVRDTGLDHECLDTSVEKSATKRYLTR